MRVTYFFICLLCLFSAAGQEVVPYRHRGGGSAFSYDTFEVYTNHDAFNGILGGVSGSLVPWNGAYVDRANAFGVVAGDDFEAYSNGALFDGLHFGSGFSGAYVDRQFAFPGLLYDTFETYADGSDLALLNGGGNNGSPAIAFTGGYVTGPGPTISFSPNFSTTLPVDVTISASGGSVAAIYYTTDGSTPTTSSTLYVSPVHISVNPTTLKAFAKGTAGTEDSVVASVSFPSTVVAGMTMWLQADALALSDGTAVSTWTDSSGNGNNAAQGTGGLQPIFHTAVQNGLAGVRFDNVDDRMTTPLTYNSGNFTIFIVYSYRGATGRRAIQGSNNWLLGPYDQSHHQFFNGSGFQDTGPALTVNVPVYVTLKVSAGGSYVWNVNGVNWGVGSTAYPGTLGLGAQGAFAEPLSGDIFEVIIYSSALSSGDISSNEQYLKAKWGL